MQQYVTANEGGGATTLVTPGLTGPVLLPPSVVGCADRPGASETPQREPSRPALIMVVNGAIAGLAAALVFGAVEVAIHVLP